MNLREMYLKSCNFIEYWIFRSFLSHFQLEEISKCYDIDRVLMLDSIFELTFIDALFITIYTWSSRQHGFRIAAIIQPKRIWKELVISLHHRKNHFLLWTQWA
jgi:hypothetical protein